MSPYTCRDRIVIAMCVVGLDVGVVCPRHKQARQARSGGVGTEQKSSHGLETSACPLVPATCNHRQCGKLDSILLILRLC